MIESILQFLFNGFIKVIPVILSNLSPVLARVILPGLNYPVDFNKKLKDGKRIFGSHKTWRGVIAMIITGLLIGYLTVGLYYGLLIGIGVVLGDLLTSLIKRRINLEPGASFEPLESLILMLTVFVVTWNLFNIYEEIIIVIFAPLVYKAFQYLGYFLKLQKHPW